MSDVIGRLIDDAQRQQVYDCDWKLAGYVRDSWAAWLWRADYQVCLYVAQVVLFELPDVWPHCALVGFDKELLAPWKERARTRIKTKLCSIWQQFPGYWKWRKYRMANHWRRYRAALRLVDVTVEICSSHSFNLALQLIMHDRPELLPILHRRIGMEIGCLE